MDDHPALTRGLAALFNQEPDLEVSGQFAGGEALLAYLEASPTPPPACCCSTCTCPRPTTA
ncbi:MAG: hypothetical protein WKG07_38495 [Hymenobacter sp.]